MKLFLKGARCNSPKCVTVRRPYRPGVLGKMRRRPPSEYGTQLLEKQRLRVFYGLREAQLTKIFGKALSRPGSLRDVVLGALERQLVNVIFRLGLAPSRVTARQWVSHGHFRVNAKKVTIPSYEVKIGDRVSLNPSSRGLLIFGELSDNIKRYEAPDWLFLDKEKLEGEVKSLPQEVELPFDINLVVDYYSK